MISAHESYGEVVIKARGLPLAEITKKASKAIKEKLSIFKLLDCQFQEVLEYDAKSDTYRLKYQVVTAEQKK